MVVGSEARGASVTEFAVGVVVRGAVGVEVMGAVGAEETGADEVGV